MRTLLLVLLPALVATQSLRGADDKPQTKPPAEVLKITPDIPKDAPTLEQVNSGRYTVTVSLENTGKEDLVLWPFLSAQVLDAKGNPVRPSRLIGRSGVRFTDSVLEGVKFVTLKPGQTHRIPVSLPTYVHDPKAITGWQLPAAGEYKLVLHYQFDRADVKKALGKGCKDLDNPKRPWNQAIEADKKMEVPLKVKAS